jgi:hypothetical protein
MAMSSRVKAKRALTRLSDWFAARSGDADDERTLLEAMAEQPPVSPRLKRIDGGLSYVLECLRCYDDEDARAFLALYDSRTKQDRSHLTWEAIAVAAGLTTSELYKAAMDAVRIADDDGIKAVLTTSGRKLTEHLVSRGLKDKDPRMLEMALRARGVLASPKGSQTAIQIINPAGPAQIEERSGGDDTTPWDQEQQLRSLHDAGAFGQPRALPAAATRVRADSAPLPAEVEQIQRSAIAGQTDV